ncbi:GNAT family N-acetyltransferase [Thalassotalea montiporae]
MKIRKANKNDIDIAWEIRKESIQAECANHYSPELISVWLNGSLPESFAAEIESNFYVATQNEEIIGLGALSYKEKKIYAIFTKPQFMGKGVAKTMMQYLEELAIKNQLNTVYLDSTLNAASFYRSLGYVGEEVTKYNNPRGFVMDCVAMHKSLSTL